MFARLSLAIVIWSAAASLLAQPAKRLALPDDAKLATASKLVAEIYRPAFEAAKTAQAKQSLATKMLKDAEQTSDDPAAKFAMLKTARRIATGIGNVDVAMSAVDATSKAFELNDRDLRREALTELQQSATSPADHYLLTRHAAWLIKSATDSNQFAPAIDLAKFALVSAGKSKDSDLTKQWTRREQELRRQEERFAAAHDSLEKLKTSPTDAEANAIAGKYYCLVKEDWATGIPMLALGNNAALQPLAAQELKAEGNPADQLAVADAWYDFAANQMDADGLAVLRHAQDRYQRALPTLSALAKRRVEQRLDEIALKASQFPIGEWVEILDLVDKRSKYTTGSWNRAGLAWVGRDDGGLYHLALPVIVDGSYELRIRAVRSYGQDTMNVALSRSTNGGYFGFNTWFGEVSGLSDIHGKHAKENGTAIPPLKIPDGQPFTLDLLIDRKDDKLGVQARVDNKPYFKWQGDANSVGTGDPNKQITLGSWKNSIIVQSVRFKLKTGRAWTVE